MVKKTKATPKRKEAVCRMPFTQCEIEGKKQEPQALSNITWRIFRIMAEFVEGFEFISQFSREISIFGSARFDEKDHWYKEARELGRLLAKAGFTVVTGGGPGVMEAANRGALEGGGESVGINIQLPLEQRINPYVTQGKGFHYFFTRKVMLSASAQGYVFFPGGYGTLDEMFEMLTLVETGKAQRVAMVLVGKEHWKPLVDWLRSDVFMRDHAISAKDLGLFEIVDTAKEAFELMKNTKERTIF